MMAMATTDEQAGHRTDSPKMDGLRHEMLRTIQSSHARMSTRDVMNRFCGPETPRRSVRQTMNRLVADGAMRYVNDKGLSFLEINYADRFRVSDRVWIAPPLVSDIHEKGGTVTVRIAPGAAFGDGRHPTTRLLVRAIDEVLTGALLPEFPETGLDIGTGSGILAITAGRLGVKQITATDIDPCARTEARKNILENGLDDRITVSDSPAGAIPSPVALVMANLRLPMLKSLSKGIGDMLTPHGAVVLSGVEEEAAGDLLSAFQDGFNCAWHQTEGGWAAVALTRKDDITLQ